MKIQEGIFKDFEYKICMTKKDKVLIEKPDIVIEKHLPDTAIVPKPTIPDAPPVDKKMDDKPRILDLNDIDPNRHAPRR